MTGLSLYLTLSFGLIVSVSGTSYYSVLHEEWEAFKLQYGKSYDSKVEESFRMNVFIDNKRTIAKHNQLYSRGEKTFSARMNEFGDLLPQEFQAQMHRTNSRNLSQLKDKSDSVTFIGPDDDVKLPNFVDWREQGAVTPVQNQGKCRAGWSFSATGSMEGQLFRKTGSLVSLSEQNLIDCTYANRGCHGGIVEFAFDYVLNNPGLDTAASYPYKAELGKCHFNHSTVAVLVKNVVYLPMTDEQALQKAVATVGPVSISMDTSDYIFQFYHNGTFFDPICDPFLFTQDLLVVGYGTDTKEKNGDTYDYWIIKNSWGTSWGVNGYMKLIRNHNNNCGVASSALYPIVENGWNPFNNED